MDESGTFDGVATSRDIALDHELTDRRPGTQRFEKMAGSQANS